MKAKAVRTRPSPITGGRPRLAKRGRYELRDASAESAEHEDRFARVREHREVVESDLHGAERERPQSCSDRSLVPICSM